MLSANELRREAKIILGLLVRGKGRLVKRSVGWALLPPEEGPRSRLNRVREEIVRAMISAGWIEAEGKDGWRATAEGRAWLEGRPVSGTARRKAEETREVVDPDGISRRVRVTDESPLDWLARRKDRDGKPYLSREEVMAGERLRRDYETGLLGAKVTASWDPALTCSSGRRRGGGKDGLNLSERAIAARQRVHAALTHVGPGLDEILLEVCCLSRGLEAAERRLGWPRRSARLVLRMALSRLAEHYGFTKTPERDGRRLLSWGLPGYSPDRALTERSEELEDQVR